MPSRPRSAGARRWRALTLALVLLLAALGLVDCHFLGVDCPAGEHYYACAVYGCGPLGTCLCEQPGPRLSSTPDTVYICATSEAAAALDPAAKELVVPPNKPDAHLTCYYSIARVPPPLHHPEDVGTGGGGTCLSLGGAGGAGGDGAGGDGFGGSSDIGTGVGASSDVGGVSTSADVGAGPSGAGGFGELHGRGGAGGAGGAW